jgi:radical SAM protein
VKEISMQSATLDRTLLRYDTAPHLVFWETTKACDLACKHCRASAQVQRLPGELTTAEGYALIDQITAMEGTSPILIFTGGDCLSRDDLMELIGYARSCGLRLGVAPSVTSRLTKEVLEHVYTLGVRSISISLDGATADSHDALRGIPGHFDETLAALRMMRDIGFRVQVNTTVMRHNAYEMASVFLLLRDIGISIWEVFFLVGVGRGVAVLEVEPRDAEDICHFLVDVTTYGMTVRTVEAPFFRRVQAEREQFGYADPRGNFELGQLYDVLHKELARESGAHEYPIRSTTLATGDGRGIVFVGFNGDVHASGFLPVALGNVKNESLSTIYTNNELVTSLRDGALTGECGRCEYRRLCGGSRARAYSLLGHVLADDPLCIRTSTIRRIPLALL